MSQSPSSLVEKVENAVSRRGDGFDGVVAHLVSVTGGCGVVGGFYHAPGFAVLGCPHGDAVGRSRPASACRDCHPLRLGGVGSRLHVLYAQQPPGCEPEALAGGPLVWLSPRELPSSGALFRTRQCLMCVKPCESKGPSIQLGVV